MTLRLLQCDDGPADMRHDLPVYECCGRHGASGSALVGREKIRGLGNAAGRPLLAGKAPALGEDPADVLERIAERGAALGTQAIDAPVSGGDIGARNATLSIMCGGTEAAFQAARPVLDLLGKTVVLQGPAGAGQHTKMVNQLLIAGTMLGMAEALSYAKKAGLNPETVLQSVGGGAAASWSLTNLAPRILKSDFAPGFFIEHFLKDLRIALDEARALGLDLPCATAAERTYRALAEAGYARAGTQAIVHAYGW